MRALAAACLVLAAAGCSGVDRRLYHPGEPPVLRDGRITMTTLWAPGREESREVRTITARDGRISVEVRSPVLGHRTGEAPVRAWEELWERLLDAGALEPGRHPVEPDDPEGGPYHEVELVLGGRTASFSAQHRTNLLVFSSKEVTNRLKLSNAIVRFTARHATRILEPPASRPASGPAGEKG